MKLRPPARPSSQKLPSPRLGIDLESARSQPGQSLLVAPTPSARDWRSLARPSSQTAFSTARDRLVLKTCVPVGPTQ
eukprot:9186290-Alexandrium_andersonii.AAC.1